VGITIKYLTVGDLPQHVLMFTGREEIGSYGELVHIGMRPDDCEQPLVSQGLPVDEGLFVLKAQDRILKFLCACVRHIMHEVPTEDLLNSPSLPPPALPEEKTDGFASLALMAAEAPYRVPAQLDFDRVVSLLSAKRDQAADHLFPFERIQATSVVI